MKLKQIAIFLVALFSMQYSIVAQNTWEKIFPSGDIPTARQGHSMITIDNLIYLYGGNDDSRALKGGFGRIHTYNAQHREWLEEEPENTPPPARFSHKAIERDGKVYIFFGEGDNGVMDDIWVYDPSTKLWNLLIPISQEKPSPRSEHSAVVNDGNVYIVGGKDENGYPLQDFWAFDPDSNAWKKLNDFPYGKIHGHTSVVYQDNLLIYGGLLNGSMLRPQVYIYSLTSNTWSSIMPSGEFYPTSNAASVKFGSKVFLFGGFSGYYEPYCFSWDLRNHSFKRLSDGPPVAYSASAWIRSIPDSSISISTNYFQIVLFGGANESSVNNDTWIYTSDIEITDISDDIFSETPSTFALSQNYPNPFNPTTTIEYTIPFVVDENFHHLQTVKLIVYDILGREVAALVNENLQPGNYKVTFDASRLTTGVYFYQLKAGGFIQTKKMILMQ